MTDDKIICNIESDEGQLLASFHATCSGYRVDKKTQPKMATAELSIPSHELIESMFYCEENKTVSEVDLFKLYKENKIIELKGYYAMPAYIKDRKSSGLPPKLLKSLIPVLKTHNFEYIILHAAGDEKLVKYYKKLGIKFFDKCVMLQLLLSIIGSLGEMDAKGREVLLGTKSGIEQLKNLAMESWSENTGDADLQNLMFGNLDEMQNALGKDNFDIYYTSSKKCAQVDYFNDYESCENRD